MHPLEPIIKFVVQAARKRSNAIRPAAAFVWPVPSSSMGDAVPVVVTNQTRGAFARKPVRVERVFASGFRRTRYAAACIANPDALTRAMTDLSSWSAICR